MQEIQKCRRIVQKSSSSNGEWSVLATARGGRGFNMNDFQTSTMYICNEQESINTYKESIVELDDMVRIEEY
jgi:hypothetical protein